MHAKCKVHSTRGTLLKVHVGAFFLMLGINGVRDWEKKGFSTFPGVGSPFEGLDIYPPPSHFPQKDE